MLLSLVISFVYSCTDEADEPGIIVEAPHINLKDSIAVLEIYNAMGDKTGYEGELFPEDMRNWKMLEFELDESVNEYRVCGIEISCVGYRELSTGDLISSNGYISDAIGDLECLESLTIKGYIDWYIPESITKLKLKKLAILHTKLRGPLPDDIFNGDMTDVFIYGNKALKCELPKSFAKLGINCKIGPVYYDIVDNAFFGAVPVMEAPEIGVQLSGNNFTSFPVENVMYNGLIRDWKGDGNQFSGQVPEELFNPYDTITAYKYLMVTSHQQDGYGMTGWKKSPEEIKADYKVWLERHSWAW